MNKFVVCLLASAFAASALLAGPPRAHAADATADLALQARATKRMLRPGQKVTYTIIVTNLGPDTTGVAIWPGVTDSLEQLTLRCGRGGVAPEGPRGRCLYQMLPAGESVTARLVAFAPPSLEQELEAGMTVEAQALDADDPDPTNNTAVLEIPIIP